MQKDEAEGWQRLGAMVANARKDLGYTNRDDFAAAVNVSVRVLADLEAGTRNNFSSRSISNIEAGIGWPAGTIDQAITNADFEPPSPTDGGSGLLYRPPLFNRQPVQVEVGAVERTIGTLTDVSKVLSANTKPATVTDVLQRLSAQVIALCWPYVIRLVEENCFPGNELHPSVRPFYEVFLERQAEFAPEDTSGLYVKWLAGDLPGVPEAVRRRYMARWNESRKATPEPPEL
ncbi:Uncharacterised protein [Mycobacteroides abscessus subsp. bolletii]|nr:Uncharacterised protein [Mycobacteroides abscessus]SKF61953.1 Uncharacterised protein [Mycobacteroides abscessus subsp. bolletii]SKH89302.1 Uncharacterised protein [Mycobacteroides abscessus subsp. bolletii]